MLNYLYVALGSAAGGVTRYAVGPWLQRRLDDRLPHAGALALPAGTILVNVTGSFLLGALIVVIARQGVRAEPMRLLLAVGFCGGYTTFSTFSAETVGLAESGAGQLALLNVAASVGLALAATLLGALAARALLGRAA
jgi:CrcB protein